MRVALALEILVGILGVFLFYCLITIVWQQVELKLHGQVAPRKLDDAVAVVLAISLYFNLK